MIQAAQGALVCYVAGVRRIRRVLSEREGTLPIPEGSAGIRPPLPQPTTQG